MSASRSAALCAGVAGLVAAFAVADQRVGLALSVALLLVLAAGLLAAGRRPSIPLTVLGIALAMQPVLRDAGWVVAATVAAVPFAGAAAVCSPATWRRLGTTVIAPFLLIGGALFVVREAQAASPALPGDRVVSVIRGLALGAALLLVFGVLFIAADSAFADLVERTFTLDLQADEIIWRALVGVAFLAVAGALARGAVQEDVAGRFEHLWSRVPGSVELRIALATIVALFTAFVVVQLHVLFGGAEYVQKTTGLGYGEYARQGFVVLLFVAALTLALVGIASRQQDRVVRGLLGALCLLTLVVLVSALHRLELVEDAYGLTRVRYAGYAIVAWFFAMFGLVIASGLHRVAAQAMPRIVIVGSLVGVLAFSLSDPDARIADSAVTRAGSGSGPPVDVAYLAELSADALPALERLAEPERGRVIAQLRGRLARPDGVLGANIARARAR